MSARTWIEWSGGKCPVHESTTVDVKFRDGYDHRDCYGSTADSWNWYHNTLVPDEDIIAYRVVEPHFLDSINRSLVAAP